MLVGSNIYLVYFLKDNSKYFLYVYFEWCNLSGLTFHQYSIRRDHKANHHNIFKYQFIQNLRSLEIIKITIKDYDPINCINMKSLENNIISIWREHIKLIVNYEFPFLILEVNKKVPNKIQTYSSRSDKNKTLVNIINKALISLIISDLLRVTIRKVSLKLLNVMIN